MFQYFFEHAVDPVWLIDPDTAEVVDCNEAAAVLMRCASRADLVGKRLEELSSPRQRDGSATLQATRRIAETLKSGKNKFEWRSQRFDGTDVSLEVNATAIERYGETVIVLVSREVSEGKEEERAPLESEVRFRSFFERSADALSFFDPQILRNSEANEAAARLVGAPDRDALRNVSPVESWPGCTPDGRLSIEKAREMIELALGVLRHEQIGPARDWSVEEIDFVSALASMVSLALEESNRARSEDLLRESAARLRESEERFSTAFRASPALISLWRLSDGKFVEVNDAFARWLGLDRDNIVGYDTKQLDLWLNHGDRETFLADLRRKGSVSEVEYQFRSRHGTVHSILLSAEIIEINHEPHVLGFGIDITERKRAEVELHRTLAREKELGQLRSHFVSTVSHEFRTPLGIIQSSAEILEDYLEQLKPTERKDHLRSIRQNTRRMAKLMEEALLLGSLDAGKLEFKPGPVELRTFLRRLVDEVQSATNRRCPIELLVAEVPAGIKADEQLLQHIFTNLLTNAVKYSDPGRVVRFEIACAGAEVVCAIRDQGIGIPEADREWLFNPFQRGRNADDRPGTGLGLVIVKRCVDLHGGGIKVESRPGQGTVVTVRLPI